MTVQSADEVRDPETAERGLLGGRWSFGILVVATLRIIDAISLIAVGLGLKGVPFAGAPILANSSIVTQSANLIFAGAVIVGVIGLLAYRRWGWVLTMVLVGVELAFELIRVAIGQPDHLGLLFLVVSAFYLNQRSVRAMAASHLNDDVVVEQLMDDLGLLQRHEPVVRFTEGEHFFPMAADTYVGSCDLLLAVHGERPYVIVPAGELTLERLASERPVPGEERFLRFVPRPMDRFELARWNRRPDRPVFRAPGRLARVGLFARLVDAGFTGSLLVRGRVPGGTAAAAAQRYAAIRLQDQRVVYHGRVVRADGWIVLQYLFVYCMNDWRSSFFGANDHEADLEQAFVVLEDDGSGDPIPRWFGCAAHDYAGDDLRRRWDDPTLSFVDGHPVIFAGAGSHASYFEQGEYVTPVPLPALRPARAFLEGLRRLWRDVLRQDDPGDLAASVETALSIPFIDYARGDGLVVGPGGDVGWTPILVDETTGWIDGFRGLWGLDTRDRFAGERAPAGPKYTRGATARQSWNDPLGFLGLDKSAPPHRVPSVLRDRIATLEADRAATAAEADARAVDVRRAFASLPVRTAETEAETGPTREELALRVAESELATLRARDATLADELEAARAALAHAEAGEAGDPRAHLRHDHRPQPPEEQQYGRLVEFWSAISAGVLVIVLAVLLYLELVPIWGAVLLTVGGYVALEAAFRRRLVQLVLRLTLLLAIIGAIVLGIAYLPLIIVAAIAGVALLAIVDNVRELRS